MLSVWEYLVSSPILKDFEWSPIVQAGVRRNLHLLLPSGSEGEAKSLSLARTSTIPGLVSIHLRRGDYVRHCPRLQYYGSTFLGFNMFPELPDRLGPERPFDLARCWPEIDDIVRKLKRVREEHRRSRAETLALRLGSSDDSSPSLDFESDYELRRVYILTNGWSWWVRSLRWALLDDGWSDVRTSLDVALNSEERYVSMAIDMAMAEKAEVFVGNGVSFFFARYVQSLSMVKSMNTVLQLDIEYSCASNGKRHGPKEQSILVMRSLSPLYASQ